MVSILLDLILIGIVLLCGWRGFRTGIINGVCGILAVIIALYGASLIASVYYSEFTDVLEPFAGGVTESAISKVTDWSGSSRRGNKSPAVILSDEEKEDANRLSYAVFRQIGLNDSVSEELSGEVSENVDDVGYALSQEISVRLCDRVIYVAIFLIVFLLIAIVFFVIGNIFDISFGLPGHEKLNYTAGAVLGVFKGILIIMVIGCFCRYICLIMPENIMRGTFLLEGLASSDLLASILGM